MKNISKRLLSLLLCLVMVVSYLPAGTMLAVAEPSAQAMLGTDRVTDPSTLNQWKQYFGVQTGHAQGVQLSTEFAGGVWTDKSVFKPGDDLSELTRALYNGKRFTFEDKGDNFLVALSALASNKQIKGYSTIPTDTVLILDLSSSMRYTGEGNSSAVDELASATNSAISKLMALNDNNRVAVVLYAGTDNASWSSRDGKTTVLLPLDSYTTTANGRYVESTRNASGTRDYALQVVNGVKNSNGQAVHQNTRFDVSTGTFAQDGLYESMRLLLNANPVVEEGFQAGTSRIPIMVLMSDGEPTLGNPTYYGNYTTGADGKKTFTGLGNSVMYNYDGSTEDRNGIRHRDTIAFMTSLTAAFAKKQVTAHYNEQALLYTLSYGNTVTTLTEAMSLLNPRDASSIQNTMWNNFLAGQNVTVYRQNNQRLTTRNSTDPDLQLTAADRYYVDEYFAASNDAAMGSAFDAIVNEIELQSRYYPTFVEDDHNHGGYLTFVDKIGDHMEITDIKGIVIGNRLFSGEAMASSMTTNAMGSVTLPSGLGDKFVQSVQERLGIENLSTAQTLINNAYRHSQLAYNAQTGEFSHYIGWFSDANGKFVDFWHEDLAKEAYPANATHIMRSYVFLGDTTVIPGVPNTDMMFMTVRIATEISSGDSIVTWKIPASLVPTVTYEVEVELDNSGKLIGLQSLELADNSASDPIRLLYEVELERDITEYNILEKTNGNTTFYTNKYDAADPFSTTLNTYSHFEPSLANERYYYTSDHLLYTDTNGTVYTGAKPTSGTYYHQFPVYEKTASGLRVHYHYEPVTAASLALAEPAGNNQWAVPKGTVLRYQDDVTTKKTENATGTMEYSDHPEIIAENNHYYTYSTQGNNGKLTVTPATGIKLTKQLTEAVDGAVNSFTFTISGNVAGAQVIRLNADGTEKSREALTNGQVTLTAGETIYIIGLAAGSYTVTENSHDSYVVTNVTVNSQLQSGTAANVTLSVQDMAEVSFTNSPKGYGNLLITKEIRHANAGHTIPENQLAQDFTVIVNVGTDLAGKTFATKQGFTEGQITVGADGSFTATIRHGHAFEILGLPDGTVATVVENTAGMPSYYSFDYILTRDHTGAEQDRDNQVTIGTDANATAVIHNVYTPAPTSANLALTYQKEFVIDDPLTQTTPFTFQLQKWNGQGWDTVNEHTLSYQPGQSGVMTHTPTGGVLGDITYTQTGDYAYRIIEVIPSDSEKVPGVSYDRTEYTLTVRVTDQGGQLAATVYCNDQPITGPFTAAFTNTYHTAPVSVDVFKQVVDTSGNPELPKTFYFDAYQANSDFATVNERPDASVQANAAGEARFAGTYTTPGTFYFVVKERNTGWTSWTYDETEYRITVVVSDDGTGDLKGDVSVEKVTVNEAGKTVIEPVSGNAIAFQNTYDPVDAQVDLNTAVRKELTGKALKDGEFTFALFENGRANHTSNAGALLTATNAADGSVDLGSLSFSKIGVYEYDIVELLPNADGKANGITYDSQIYDLVVEVTDDHNGKLIATWYFEDETSQTVTFRNSYQAEPAEHVIDGTKNMTGRPLLLGGFQFRLTEVADANGTAKPDGITLTAENGAAGQSNSAPFRFSPITYTEAGTHYYTIEEVNTGAVGVTYSTTVYTIQVVVTDNGEGKLVATESVISGGNSIVFNNSYKPQPITTSLKSVKTLNGKVLTAGQFSFSITQTESDFATAVAGGLNTTVTNGADGLIQFPDITFYGNDTRYYLIEEVNGGKTIDGITYDDAQYLVTVTATDNLLGSLVLVTDIQVRDFEEINGTMQEVIASASSISFTNEYAIKGDATVILSGAKTLDGKELADGMFTFQLLDDSGAVVASGNNTGSTYSIRLDYTADADLGKTYTYTLKELYAGQTINGMTYDSKTYAITVKVEDNGVGGIKLTVTTDGQQTTANKVTTVTGLNFKNTYTAKPAQLTLDGTKQLTGKTLAANAFTFELYETDASFAVTASALDTAKNGADGKFTFDTRTLDAAGTYYFAVKEQNGGQTVDGITYDPATYRITVTVIDDGKGQLVIDTITYRKDTAAASGIAFVNTYDTGNATATIQGKKTLNGKALSANMFTFQLFATDSRFSTNGVTPVETKNAADGTYSFNLPTFTAAGTYYYLVREKDGGKTIDGISYSTMYYPITVKVSDNGKGQLIPSVTGATATVSGSSATITGVDFINTYTPAPTAFAPQAIKRYERPDGELMRAFEFLLTGHGISQYKVNNTTDGKVLFDPIPLAAAGTYTYTISEIPTQAWDFIKWDTNQYTLTVVVTDNGVGQLEVTSITATSIKGDDDLQFLNAHEDLILKKDVVLQSAPTVSIDRKAVEVGDELTYKITYTNYNNQTASATITDTVPQYTSFLSADNGGTFADGKVTWELKDVPTGEARTVFFQVKVTGGVDQRIPNQATVLDAGNTYTSNEVVNPVKEDKIEKDVFTLTEPTVSIDGKKVETGDVLLYKVTYRNSDDFAADVTITDTIPQYTEYVTGSADNGGAFAEGKLTWNLQLAAGEEKTVSFQVKVTGNGGQTVINQASGTEGENTIETNQVHNPITQDQVEKDVFLAGAETVTIDGKKVEAGDVLTYRIAYKNTDDFAANVIITDTIPQYTEYVAGSADNGGTLAGDTLTWNLQLAAGEEKTVSFQVKVTGAQTTAENTAEAREGVNVVKTNTVSNPVTQDEIRKDVFAVAEPTVSIDGQKVKTDDILLYKVTYRNSDDAAATVTITDTIPQYTEYVTGSADNGGAFAEGKLTWNLQLAAGEEKTVSFQVKVTGQGNQAIVNQAAGTEDENTIETNQVSNPMEPAPVPPPKEDDTIEKDVFLPGQASVSIDGQTVNPGQILEYHVTYRNGDNKDAVVTITDTIPANTTYVEGSADGAVFTNGQLVWVLNLAAGEKRTVSFRVKVIGTNTTVVNQASGTSGQNTIASNRVENPVKDDELLKTVAKASEPTVSADGKKVDMGTELLYTITYKNTDHAAAEVTVTDTIPVNTLYVDGSADNGGVYQAGTLTWKLALAPGESKTVSFKVTANAYKTTLVNQATATDGVNKLESNQVTVETPAAPETPKTGDDMNLILWFSLLGISAAAMAAAVIFRKKILK